jgi:hypothetical protein
LIIVGNFTGQLKGIKHFILYFFLYLPGKKWILVYALNR